MCICIYIYYKYEDSYMIFRLGLRRLENEQ